MLTLHVTLQVVLLDGVDRMDSDALATLSSLLLDGFCWLPDGSVLVPQSSIQQWNEAGYTNIPDNIRATHPDFRFIAFGWCWLPV